MPGRFTDAGFSDLVGAIDMRGDRSELATTVHRKPGIAGPQLVDDLKTRFAAFD
ncbi:Uncharacterised protein [Mycobacterium tuberculosis]|nr:Uncharacterised protein [Mycobacterium tuberculosis]SGP32150.1 Uncharacterised protein [Mycobacterium tuberculosis]